MNIIIDFLLDKLSAKLKRAQLGMEITNNQILAYEIFQNKKQIFFKRHFSFPFDPDNKSQSLQMALKEIRACYSKAPTLVFGVTYEEAIIKTVVLDAGLKSNEVVQYLQHYFRDHFHSSNNLYLDWYKHPVKEKEDLIKWTVLAARKSTIDDLQWIFKKFNFNLKAIDLDMSGMVRYTRLIPITSGEQWLIIWVQESRLLFFDSDVDCIEAIITVDLPQTTIIWLEKIKLAFRYAWIKWQEQRAHAKPTKIIGNGLQSCEEEFKVWLQINYNLEIMDGKPSIIGLSECESHARWYTCIGLALWSKRT